MRPHGNVAGAGAVIKGEGFICPHVFMLNKCGFKHIDQMGHVSQTEVEPLRPDGGKGMGRLANQGYAPRAQPLGHHAAHGENMRLCQQRYFA